MRQLLAGVLGLALVAPAWADDKPKADAPPVAKAKSPKDQVQELAEGFQKEMGDLQKEFRAAKTQEEKMKIRDKALNQVSVDYAKKMMAVATANPKDPAAVDALEFVCSAPGDKVAPLVPDALKLLLANHAGSEQLVTISQAMRMRDDGEKLIRDIREKTTNPSVKLQVGFVLAESLREKDEATEAENKEAEKLLVDFIAGAKERKDIPPALVAGAEAGLKELRTFAVGKPAPAAESKDLDDKAVKLADYKGKVVVLDFWATWCGPCKGMIPHERELVKKHAGKPFVFVSISADEKKEDLTNFLKEESMPWVHWFGGPGGGGVIAAWNIHAFPTMYVIDANGVIRGKIVGGGPKNEKKLDELVEKCVKEAKDNGTE
jgi:thiol-disulfide isomerase/thioredoxin